MEPEYDEQGNIPGPGPSRVGTIPTWQSEEDEDVLKHENRWGKEFADISKDVIVQAATQGRFTDPPASEQTIDVAVSEVIEMHPNIYKKAVIYHRNNPDAGWSAAMRAAKLSAGSSPENLHRRFMKSPKDRFPDAGDVKNVYNPDQLDLPFDQAKLAAYQKSMRNPNIPQQVRTDLALSVKGSVYKTSEPFDVFKFREQTKYIKDKGRKFLSIFQAGITQYGASKAASFKVNQPTITAPLKEEYKRTNLPETSFQVHHRAALKAIMGNFHGLDIGSPVFNKVADAILEEIPWLGLGDNPENWMGIIGSTADKGTPHHLAHKYYDKIIGPSGELIFDKPTVDRMMVDEDFRIEMATKVGQIINKSNQIVTQATKLWKLGFSNKQRFKNFDALVNHLSKFDELGYDALSDPEYEACVFTDIATQIATDPSMVPPPEPKNTRGQEVLQDLYRLEELQKDTKEADLSLKEQQKKPKPLSNEQQLNILDEVFGPDEIDE